MKIRNFKIKAQEKALYVVLATAIILSLSTLVSCSSDEEEVNSTPSSDATLEVKLTIQTRAEVEGYSEGSQWENYIDIAGGNYRIYFFTNDKDDATATSESEKNTLIAVFNPFNVTVVEGSNYTEYEVTGDILETIAEYSNFKVVVLANWAYASTGATYPTVTPGVTTIDDLCENDNATFEASRFLDTGVTSSRLVPFFGVNEYKDVEWKSGTYTDLSGTEIMMLRALAKVEVIRADEKLGEFSSVSITRYNTSGYSAPKNVYLRGDYFHDYTWNDDFTSSLHLVGDSNYKLGLLTHTFNKVEDAENDTWVIYLPEYDNSSTDYSYITVKFTDGTEKIIYFGNYVDGECTAYETGGNTSDRFNIYRNYYYSFTVNYVDRAVINSYYFDLNAPDWSNHFENDSSTDLIKHD